MAETGQEVRPPEPQPQPPEIPRQTEQRSDQAGTGKGHELQSTAREQTTAALTTEHAGAVRAVNTEGAMINPPSEQKGTPVQQGGDGRAGTTEQPKTQAEAHATTDQTVAREQAAATGNGNGAPDDNANDAAHGHGTATEGGVTPENPGGARDESPSAAAGDTGEGVDTAPGDGASPPTGGRAITDVGNPTVANEEVGTPSTDDQQPPPAPTNTIRPQEETRTGAPDPVAVVADDATAAGRTDHNAQEQTVGRDTQQQPVIEQDGQQQVAGEQRQTSNEDTRHQTTAEQSPSEQASKQEREEPPQVIEDPASPVKDARMGTEAKPDGESVGGPEPTADANPVPDVPAAEDGTGDLSDTTLDTEANDAREAADRPTLQRHGHGLPDSHTLRYELGPDRLVDSINGRPAKEFVQELSQQRNDLYRQMQTDRTKLPDGRRVNEDFTKNETGKMHSVLFDRRTGQFFEADNRTLGKGQPTNLHPTLQNELNRMNDFDRQNPNHYDYGHGQRGGFPHPDVPGTHSEVASANQALWAREAAGHPTGPDALQELIVDNRRLFGDNAGSQAQCCANCTSILGNIVTIPGKKTEFP